MPESMMQCPICGRMFPTRLAEVSENGNMICPDDKKKELEKLNKTDKK